MKTIQGEEKVRAELVLCHIDDEGTGSAVKFAVVPASCYETGGLKVTFALEDGGVIDWEGSSVEVLMEFEDVAKLLGVLRGESERIELMFRSYDKEIKDTSPCELSFKHELEPISGYRFDVYEKYGDNLEPTHWSFLLTNSEAMGLSIALENSMSAIAFGLWRW